MRLNCSPLRSFVVPTLQSSNKCLTKKVLLKIKDIINVFTLGMWTISFAINLLILLRKSLHLYPKMNCCSWDILEFMHNIIDLPNVINDARGRSITKCCIQARKWTKLAASNLWLEYECIHCTRIFHCESHDAQSFHNHLAHNIGDLGNEFS